MTEGNIDKPVSTGRRWYHPGAIWGSIVLRPKVYLAAATSAASAVFLPATIDPSVRAATAWCAGGFAYLVLAYLTVRRCPVSRIKSQAARQDESGVVVLVLILAAVLSSVIIIAGLMSHAKVATDNGKAVYVMISGATIFMSWLVMQAVFTLHYAHEHYAPRNLVQDSPGGLEFPKDAHPDYWDFFYFAASIGAASQTSDVLVVSKGLRHLVTLHAIVAFFFNTMVLALTINLAASLI